MKIKTNKKNRLIVEYALDKIKFSYCDDVYDVDKPYNNAVLAKDNIGITDLSILAKDLHCTISSCDIYIFISRSMFLNRYLILPTDNVDEIDKMLQFQLPKLIPYSMEEIIYDYKVINQSENKSTLLVLVLQKEKLDLINNFLIKNNSVAQFTGLATELYMNAYKAADETGDTNCVVYKQSDSAELIYFDPFVKFMRSFKYTDAKSFEFSLEQSLELLDSELGPIVDDNIVTVDNLDNVYTGVADFDFNFDFSSLATQRLQRKRKTQKYLINAAAIALQLFLICFLFSYRVSVSKNRKVSFLKNEVNIMKSELGDSTVVLDKLATLENLQGSRGIFSSLLHDIISLLPNRTVISALDIDENNKFTIKGFAPNMETIFQYVTQLNNKPVFSQVSAQNVSKVRQKNSNRVEFSIDGKWLELAGGDNE